MVRTIIRPMAKPYRQDKKKMPGPSRPWPLSRLYLCTALLLPALNGAVSPVGTEDVGMGVKKIFKIGKLPFNARLPVTIM